MLPIAELTILMIPSMSPHTKAGQRCLGMVQEEAETHIL